MMALDIPTSSRRSHKLLSEDRSGKTLQEINNSWIQWNNTSRFVLLIITNKRGYNCGTIKKMCPHFMIQIAIRQAYRTCCP